MKWYPRENERAMGNFRKIHLVMLSIRIPHPYGFIWLPTLAVRNSLDSCCWRIWYTYGLRYRLHYRADDHEASGEKSSFGLQHIHLK